MADWTYTRITPKTDEADGKYYGIVDVPPTTGLLRGDSCVHKQNDELVIKAWNGYRWVELAESGLSNAEQSVICAKAQKDVLTAVEDGTVTTSEYGYFRSLIAGVVSADYIKSMEGLFENITVTGESYFFGNFNCPTIESMPGSKTDRTHSGYIRAYVDNTTRNQVDDLRTWLDDSWILPVDFRQYSCESDAYPEVKYISRGANQGNINVIAKFFDASHTEIGRIYTERVSGGLSTKLFYRCENIGKAQTLTLKETLGGDVLKVKNLPTSPEGLEQGQVYTDSNGFLRVVL